MEVRGGVIALVLVLIVGGAVWVFTTSPGLALLALLVGLVLWEYGRRSRYQRHLRYVLPPNSRSRGGARSVGTRSGGQRAMPPRMPGRAAPRPIGGRPSPGAMRPPGPVGRGAPPAAGRRATAPTGRRPLWNRTPAWKTPPRNFVPVHRQPPSRPRPGGPRPPVPRRP